MFSFVSCCSGSIDLVSEIFLVQVPEIFLKLVDKYFPVVVMALTEILSLTPRTLTHLNSDVTEEDSEEAREIFSLFDKELFIRN